MTSKVFSPANYIKHWAHEKPNACFLKQPIGSRWQSTSWAEAYDKIARLANFLKKYPKNSKIGIYSNNCRDWFLADMAIFAAGLVSVPIYPSASAKTISQIISHSETCLVFIGCLSDPSNIGGIAKQADVIAIHEKRDAMPFWLDLIKQQKPLQEFFQPDDKDIATIVYTSGTTGIPKGVVVAYRTLSGGIECIKNTLKITSDDTFFSYLPLAHIMERIAVEILSIVYGCQVSFVGDRTTFSKNLADTQPSIFIAVPRIWVKLKQGIEARLGGEARFKKLINLPFVGRFIARFLLKKLGFSKIRYCLTGAAAISTDILNWWQEFGLVICEGYGLSETLGISNLNLPTQRSIGSVGKLVNGCEMLVAENGEILLRSPCLMDGYYKEPELSAVAIQDGWFRTGDLGYVDEAGFLSIKGRIKEIFKTSKGKYISPVPIELKLGSLFSVDQVCVFGSQLSQPIAVIVDIKMAEQSDNKDFIIQCMVKMEQLNASLEKHEQLDALLISSTKWTTCNDKMTPTLKIRRQQVEDFYLPLFMNNKSEFKVMFVT